MRPGTRRIIFMPFYPIYITLRFALTCADTLVLWLGSDRSWSDAWRDAL
jgi:hypothetical protein